MKNDTWTALIIAAICFGFIIGHTTAPEKKYYVWTEQESPYMLVGLSAPQRPNPPLNMSREHAEPFQVRIGNNTSKIVILETVRGQMVLKPGEGKILTSENPASILIEEPEVQIERRMPLFHTALF